MSLAEYYTSSIASPVIYTYILRELAVKPPALTPTYLEGDDHGLGVPPAPLPEAGVQQVAALGQEGQRKVVGHGGG